MKPALQALLRRALQPKLSPDAQDRLNAGLNSAKEHLQNENFGKAFRTLEELGREYPQNPDVEILLRHAHERLRGGEANFEIEKLLSEARGKKAFGRFEPALQLVQRALELDSSNHSARALQRTLLDEQQRDRDRRTIETALQRCKSLVKQEELQEALLVVEELAAAYPRDARVAEARREIHEKVRSDGEHHQRAESTTLLLGNLATLFPARSSVQDLLDHARRLKLSEQQVAGQIGPPNHEATALHWTLPEGQQDHRETPVGREKREIDVERGKIEDQRRRDFQTGIQEGERLLSEGRFEVATKLLDDLAVQFPAETSLRDLLNRARQLEQEHIEEEEAKNTERLRLREQELSAMEAAVAGGYLEQAIHMAEAALAKFPGEPRAVAALQSAHNLRELNDLVAYARRRVRCGDLDEARQLVTDGRVRFPDSPELLEIETEIEKAGALEQSLRSVRNALKEHRFDEARMIAEPLLTAAPGNPAVQELLAEIETQRNEYERQQTYDRGRAEAERLARSLRFEAAIEKIQQLLGDFPADPALNEDLKRVSAARDLHTKRERYLRGRAEAQSLSDHGKLEEAIAIIGSLLEDFPGDPALDADLKAMQAAKLLREERIRIDVLIHELEVSFRNGDAEAVRRGAEQLLSKRKEPRAVELLDWAEKSIQSARNLRELNDLLAYARRRVRCGDLDEARQLVTDGRVRFPDSPELLEIETEIEKAGALEQSLRSVRNALKEHRFDEARMIAEPLLTAAPGNPVVQELLAEIETQRNEYERQQTYDRGRAEAERLARSLRFEAAIKKIQQLLGDFPADPALNEDLKRVSAARDLHTKRERYLRGRAEAQSLSDHGKLEEAIAIIGSLLKDFPGDPALDADLKAMQAAKLLREERIRIDVLIHELEVSFRNGDAEAVRRGAKRLLSKRKEPRAAELLDWAETSIAQTRQIRRKSRSRGPLLLSGGIGVVAVVVAAVLGLPPPPSPITVQPEEIAFFYAKGGPFPQPRYFQIKAGRRDQRWTAASSAPWLRFSKADGTGTSDVAASVNPSALSPGEYQSIATVRSAAVQKILIVRLHIAEPTESTPPPLPQEIRIEPSTLEFSYVRKGPPPPSQRFRIVTIPAGQGWTVTGGNTWVLPSRHSGAGASEVEVSVDPSNLATGDHTGIVRLTSAAAVKSLKVLLHVTEPELVFDPQVNCRDDQYNGRYTGTITWLGPLNDGEVLTIANKNVASPGRASGRELPGCPVSITSVPALNIQEPTAASNYRQIRFTNNSGHAIDSIKITWNVKR